MKKHIVFLAVLAVALIWSIIISALIQKWPKLAITDWHSWSEFFVSGIWLIFSVWLLVKAGKITKLEPGILTTAVVGCLIGYVILGSLSFWVCLLTFLFSGLFLTWLVNIDGLSEPFLYIAPTLFFSVAIFGALNVGLTESLLLASAMLAILSGIVLVIIVGGCILFAWAICS